jgi:hypothetical protein
MAITTYCIVVAAVQGNEAEVVENMRNLGVSPLVKPLVDRLQAWKERQR